MRVLTGPFVAITLVITAACGRGTGHLPADRTAAATGAVGTIVGEWEIVPVAAGGPLLAFAVDSVHNLAVYGRVLRSFAGDVVEPVDAFPSFRGRLGDDSAATIAIYQDGYSDPVYQLRVRADGDSLVLLEYRWGPNDQLAPGRRFSGRRLR